MYIFATLSILEYIHVCRRSKTYCKEITPPNLNYTSLTARLSSILLCQPHFPPLPPLFLLLSPFSPPFFFFPPFLSLLPKPESTFPVFLRHFVVTPLEVAALPSFFHTSSVLHLSSRFILHVVLILQPHCFPLRAFFLLHDPESSFFCSLSWSLPIK